MTLTPRRTCSASAARPRSRRTPSASYPPGSSALLGAARAAPDAVPAQEPPQGELVAHGAARYAQPARGRAHAGEPAVRPLEVVQLAPEHVREARRRQVAGGGPL